ncbi:MAG TPA: hypothetical protein VFM85_00245 [Actinomycetota bacterium]|nr:hypothetical protein [Actinomycetota bacterium]
MTRRVLISLVAILLVMALSPNSLASPANTRVTRDASSGSYLRYDGTSDATMAACSTGRRSQNEPTIAVDPHNTQVVVAGSNDYCAQIVNGDVWPGYYRSTDGGGNWNDSLVPGYPNDSSAAGLASPAHGSCSAAGDPSQAFDADGRLFYAFICFNRSKPINGAVYSARYLSDGSSYDRTVLIKKGSPSAQFSGSGLFQDKINIVADQTSGSFSGNVYVAWSQYTGKAANNSILFSRSTDRGLTFSSAIRVTPVEHGTGSFTDLAVGPDGAVYLTYLTYASSSRPTADIWLSKSVNGGVSFGPPTNVASITLFDSNQFSGNGAYDCGDGPFACPSGFTYSRFFSSSAVAADASGVHVVYGGELPNGQSKVFVRNSPDGVSFPAPAVQLDTVPTGHQWFPDIASAGGTITVVFYDSRDDPAYDPGRPPGNTAAGVNSGDVVHTFIARSANGISWTEIQVTTHGSNFGWETHGSRRVGFWGDYIYVSAVGTAVNVAWTDSRDLVPGVDPREPSAADGFDVLQPCTYVPNDINAPSYSSPLVSDPCLSKGGLDENIYAARV